jgi:diguanylate cyclase (GGDEF)-like protein
VTDAGEAALGRQAGSDPEDRDSLELIHRIIGRRLLRTVFQPVVEIDTRQVVAYEALTRGPADSALERPDLLFAAARRAGRLADLDVACRAAALQAARAAGLRAPYQLLINAEPDALDGWRPAGGADAASPSVILELTERELAARPAQLLQTVARVRALGWGIALDDVGAVPESLALLPLVRPDIIKLDLRLVQDRPSGDIAAVMNAVHAEAERSGTLLLAEGIETEAHLVTARAFGATLGQGWLFGRPAPLPAPLPDFTARQPVRIIDRGDNVPGSTPFQLASAQRPPRPADKRLLIEVSKHLEAQARNAGESALVLSAFQHARFFTDATRKRYAGLAAETAFVGALGEDMPPQPLPGVRGAVLGAVDPLRGEWDIAVLGPHFSACLAARDLGDDGPDLERRFEFVLSHDRELTINVASVLMSRIWPEPRTTDLPALPGPAGLSVRTPVGSTLLAASSTLDRAAGANLATALLLVDLDDFKRVNDHHGHAVGDELLRQVAGRLRALVRSDDLVARQDGDEFLLLLADVPRGAATEIAERVADDVLQVLSEAFELSSGRARIGASIGIAVAPEDGTTFGELLRHADTAVRGAKRAGRNAHRRWAAA